MSRPVVGVTAYQEPASWAAWHDEAVLVPASYVRRLAEAGALPVVVPPGPDVAGVLGRLDALVLAGGADIDPARYGAAPHPRTGAPQPWRDEAELALLAAAIAAEVPTLAICRGMQVLNVLRGGTLHQHLPDLLGTQVHAPAPGSFGRHRITIAAGSRLAAAVGCSAEVPTAHHQGVDRLGEGLTAVAWAEDGTVEALELDGPGFVVGVQCHPEAGEDPGLFHALVAAARSRGRA